MTTGTEIYYEVFLTTTDKTPEADFKGSRLPMVCITTSLDSVMDVIKRRLKELLPAQEESTKIKIPPGQEVNISITIKQESL